MMIKTYRKTATIQAERFDGSKEMVGRRYIHIFTNGYEEKYLISTLKGKMLLNIGDWIATGVEGEHWAIADEIFKKAYVEAEE